MLTNLHRIIRYKYYFLQYFLFKAEIFVLKSNYCYFLWENAFFYTYYAFDAFSIDETAYLRYILIIPIGIIKITF